MRGWRIHRLGQVLPAMAGMLLAGTAAAVPAAGAELDISLKIGPGLVDAGLRVGGGGATDTGSLAAIARIVGADRAWQAGWTGKGVDVAVIDTGVAPVPGLVGKVVNGPDLSFDSQSPSERYLDGYGHGTHMASIIAGRDVAGMPASYTDPARFAGIAPDARIVSLKVGAGDGSVDVSQVIAAVDWVSQHGRSHGLNIRVLNLAYGTDSQQAASSDPLAFAVEAARRRGILVVASGGNDGTKLADLANPARHPNVLAVGAVDPRGTLTTIDDTVPGFADRGTPTRHVDVAAPGVSVLGLRVPNAAADQAHPSARVGDRLFRGSGTSQAAAVVSGAAALLFQREPSLGPDQVRDLLVRGAQRLSLGTTLNSGAGLVDVPRSMALRATAGLIPATSRLLEAPASGTGSLDAARGSSRVTIDGAVLDGERDIFGTAWDGRAWSRAARDGRAWSGGRWNGSTLTGTGWTAAGDWTVAPWAAPSWGGVPWTDPAWTGRRWADGTWDAGSWSGRRWAESSWSGRRWADASWS